MKYSLSDFLLLKKTLKPNTPIQIVSGSMEPFIKTGETVYIDPCTPSELNPFDIIVYYSTEHKNVFVCHIFFEKNEEMIITKPLHNKNPDKPFPQEHLLGKVIKPKFSRFQKFLLKYFH